jgi:hypothetical protein
MKLDKPKTRTTVRKSAPVAQRTEQRFPKTIRAVSGGRSSTNHAALSTNSLESYTSPLGLCAPVDLSDEYSGKRLRPLWELAKRTSNDTLKRLVLQYEAQVEGVAIGGRLAG